jgi:hypothetical protein
MSDPRADFGCPLDPQSHALLAFLQCNKNALAFCAPHI